VGVTSTRAQQASGDPSNAFYRHALTRTDAISALGKVAAAKPDVFGWQPEVRPIRLRDRKTGQPTGETQEREVHHLWLRERMKARVIAIDPLARASAETRTRLAATR